MKAFQTIVITSHDGLHSLERLATYYSLPDEIESALLNRTSGKPEIHIKKNTISAYPHSSYDFWLIINIQVDLKGGERLGVIGKKGQGSSSFVHMLVGSMKKIKGNVFLSGKIAYLPDKFLFSSASVRDNIAFYNSEVTDKQIR
jgi:ATP-binding cassette subfamily B protein